MTVVNITIKWQCATGAELQRSFTDRAEALAFKQHLEYDGYKTVYLESSS